MAPIVVPLTPNGVETTPFPTLDWVFGADATSDAEQASATIRVFDTNVSSGEEFEPHVSEATWEGTVTGETSSIAVGEALPDGVYEWWVSAIDEDGVETEWAGIGFSVAVALTSEPRPAAVRGRRLGCGRHRVLLQQRGGGAGSVITELPWQTLSYGRVLDGVSAASVTVPVDAAIDDDCCYALGTMTPWEHEIAIWRDGEQAWVGVIGEPSHNQAGVVIPARDLFEWFERRLLPFDRSFTNVDLGLVFRQYLLDALSRDTSPNISVSVGPTGVQGSRSVSATAYRHAADELLEIARNGVDFTVIGRTVVVGGAEVPGPSFGPLTNESLDNATITPRGLIAATEVTMVGARVDDSDEPLARTAGGVSTRLGLVQQVYDESAIQDGPSLQAAAASRLALLGDVPIFVEGILTPEAPVAMADLVPGVRADLRVTAACREASGIWRLAAVSVSASAGDQGESETVKATFEPLGTVAA